MFQTCDKNAGITAVLEDIVAQLVVCRKVLIEISRKSWKSLLNFSASIFKLMQKFVQHWFEFKFFTCFTHSFISSSGRSCGTALSSVRRQRRITSSDVPEHEQPFVFHGRQISLSVFPKSPYCFSASS